MADHGPWLRCAFVLSPSVQLIRNWGMMAR
jgi:hypothetical protein